MATQTSKSVFQLSALSQNDSGAADGTTIFCTITEVKSGVLRHDSSRFGSPVLLPIPPGPPPAPALPTPTWFLVPDIDIRAAEFKVTISCPSDPKYPTTDITVTGAEAKRWADIPYKDRPNQIYQKGIYGIFGFAQYGPDGVIYTITAGVLNPRVHG